MVNDDDGHPMRKKSGHDEGVTARRRRINWAMANYGMSGPSASVYKFRQTNERRFHPIFFVQFASDYPIAMASNSNLYLIHVLSVPWPESGVMSARPQLDWAAKAAAVGVCTN